MEFRWSWSKKVDVVVAAASQEQNNGHKKCPLCALSTLCLDWPLYAMTLDEVVLWTVVSGKKGMRHTTHMQMLPSLLAASPLSQKYLPLIFVFVMRLFFGLCSSPLWCRRFVGGVVQRQLPWDSCPWNEKGVLSSFVTKTFPILFVDLEIKSTAD